MFGPDTLWPMHTSGFICVVCSPLLVLGRSRFKILAHYLKVRGILKSSEFFFIFRKVNFHKKHTIKIIFCKLSITYKNLTWNFYFYIDVLTIFHCSFDSFKGFLFYFLFFLIQKVVLTLSLSRILCAAAQGKNVTPLTGKRGAAPASSTTDVGSQRTCSAHAANASANARAMLAWAMECGVELMILTNYDTTGREKAASAGLSGTAGVGETITASLLSSTASEFASKRRGSPYPFTIHGDVFLQIHSKFEFSWTLWSLTMPGYMYQVTAVNSIAFSLHDFVYALCHYAGCRFIVVWNYVQDA